VVGSDTVALGQTVLVGLAVSSHVKGTTAMARFDNVTVHPAGPSGGSVPERFTASAKLAHTTLATTVDIARWSSGAERDGLIAAFRENGQDGLLAALRQLPSVASIGSGDSLEFDIHYASAQTDAVAGGRTILLLMDRPISAWEAANHPPTIDYPFMAIQLQVDKDGKGVGTALLATRIRVAADGTMQLEPYSNYSVPLIDVRKVQ
jgi:hypothetical protein